jgi:pimeloyl-ACP methyl ester carboxylesterase
VTDPLTVRCADGRDLEVLADGPPDAMPLVVHVGTPSAATPFALVSEAAAARGLRTVMCSRPGYAGSTPQPGRTVADAAGDVAAVLAALGHDRFVTLGWSGGGPHALACAALLADRCSAAATLAGVAPFGADGLDWPAGMGPENVAEFGAARAGDQQLTAYLEPQAAGLAEVTGPEVATALGGLVPPVDREALTGDLAEVLAAMFRSAVSIGIAGWRDDDLAFVRPWGFDPADIVVPLSVWQGRADRMVPNAHGEWLAARVPDVRAHLVEVEGHISLLRRMPQIIDDLLDRAAGH